MASGGYAGVVEVKRLEDGFFQIVGVAEPGNLLDDLVEYDVFCIGILAFGAWGVYERA